MLLKTSLAMLLSAGVFGLLGCGDDDDTPLPEFGAPCANDSQCLARCARGEHYPGGMCTRSCRNDTECMPGTLCVTDEGGICAFSCGGTSACANFGPEYLCDPTGRRGTDGTTLVCRRP